MDALAGVLPTATVHPAAPPPVTTASIRPRRLLSTCAGTLALAALPKCPLCLLAWAGVAGSAGFASAYGAWLLPATAAALAVTVGALAAGGAGAGPVLLALAGAAATLGGKFRLDQPSLLYAGLAALLAATLWGVLHRRRSVLGRACHGACAAAAPRIAPRPATD
ncbi:hypothetical protein [Longimicrobium sp.]|uniref:hypothetical protein n=1 Tax=Longimicrobium sp. TaxID=2029185 RepID=UPI003B3BDD03